MGSEMCIRDRDDEVQVGVGYRLDEAAGESIPDTESEVVNGYRLGE